MGTAQRGQPAGRLVQRLSGPYRTHGHRQPTPRRRGEMRAGGGDTWEAESQGQFGQLGVDFVVERMAVPGQLDTDLLLPEPVHQVGQRRRGRIRPAGGQRGADMTFATTGQDVPVPARRVGERIDVEAQFAFLAAGQVGRGQLPRQSSIAFRAASQHQQMRARRVRVVGPGAGP